MLQFGLSSLVPILPGHHHVKFPLPLQPWLQPSLKFLHHCHHFCFLCFFILFHQRTRM